MQKNGRSSSLLVPIEYLQILLLPSDVALLSPFLYGADAHQLSYLLLFFARVATKKKTSRNAAVFQEKMGKKETPACRTQKVAFAIGALRANPNHRSLDVSSFACTFEVQWK